MIPWYRLSPAAIVYTVLYRSGLFWLATNVRCRGVLFYSQSIWHIRVSWLYFVMFSSCLFDMPADRFPISSCKPLGLGDGVHNQRSSQVIPKATPWTFLAEMLGSYPPFLNMMDICFDSDHTTDWNADSERLSYISWPQQRLDVRVIGQRVHSTRFSISRRCAMFIMLSGTVYYDEIGWKFSSPSGWSKEV